MPGQHSITPVEALQDGLAHIPNGISDLLLNEIRWQDELYSRDGERRCDIPPNASEWLSELFEFGSDGVLRQAEETVADNQLIESRNETAGIDALAWYVPFHSGHSRWGIHIPIVGVAYLARHAFGHLPDPRVRWVLALDALHAHEFNHFTVEYFVALWEVLHGEAIWRSSTERLRHKKLGYILAEERLANAYMIRKVRRGGAYHALAGKTDGLRAFTSGQPRGYKEGKNRTSDTKFYPLLEEVLRSRIRTASAYSHLRHDRIELRSLVNGLPELPIGQCPVYLHSQWYGHRSVADALWFIANIPQELIVESPTFTKMHSRLPAQVQVQWARTKQKLAIDTRIPGLDFKKWPPGGAGAYSCRVNNNHRAHLHLTNGSGRWTADEIGTHADLGHG